LQESLDQNEASRENREKQLKVDRKELAKLEEQAQDYQHREEMEEKWTLTKLRRHWLTVEERKAECKQAELKLKKAVVTLKREQAKLDPVKEQELNVSVCPYTDRAKRFISVYVY